MLETRDVFFTRNHEFIGVAFQIKDASSNDLFPSASLHRPSQHLTFNLGQSPFVFDVERLIQVFIDIYSP
jgi:hypothetical protein